MHSPIDDTVVRALTDTSRVLQQVSLAIDGGMERLDLVLDTAPALSRPILETLMRALGDCNDGVGQAAKTFRSALEQVQLLAFPPDGHA
jgi:hypothetical protein